MEVSDTLTIEIIQELNQEQWLETVEKHSRVALLFLVAAVFPIQKEIYLRSESGGGETEHYFAALAKRTRAPKKYRKIECCRVDGEIGNLALQSIRLSIQNTLEGSTPVHDIVTFSINIRPRSRFGVDEATQATDAQDLAKEIQKLEGVEKAECFETIEKGAAGAYGGAVVVTALIGGDKETASTLIKQLLRLLRQKRKEGKYEAYSIEIHNVHFHLADDTEEAVEVEIRKLIESAPDCNQPDSRFVKILQGIKDRLDVDFAELSSQITHRGAKGYAREKALIQDFLQKYLPARFGLTRGEIIASNGEVSGECDAIVYDALECPALHTVGEYQIVPVEAVYAVVEVKSHLDSNELESTFNKFQKIKTRFLFCSPCK